MKPLQTFLILSLMLVASLSSAQTKKGTLEFSLDSTPVTYQFGQNQGAIPTDTVRGYIKNLTSDSVSFALSKIGANQWIIKSIINGKTIYWIDDTMVIGPSVNLPINIFFVPYPDGIDTENVCFTLTPKNGEAVESCVPAYIEAQSEVTDFAKTSDFVLMPNPANQYILVNGLNAFQATMSYQIISTIGSVVAQGGLINGSRIDLHDVPDGTYWLLSWQSGNIIEKKAFTVLH